MRKPHAPRPEMSVPSKDDDGYDADAVTDDGEHFPRQSVARGSKPEHAELTLSRELRGDAAGAAGDISMFSRRDMSQSQMGEGQDRPSRVVSWGLAQRREERRRELRALRWRRVARAAVAVVAVLVLVWVVFFSPLLALRSSAVTVTGSDGSVTVEEIQALTREHEGTSLVRLNLGQVESEISAALVHVRSAQVTRSWPHGLEVTLTMRVPVAVHEVNGGYEVLDGDAVVLEIKNSAPEGLVRVSDPKGSELTGAQVDAVAQAVGALDVATRGQVVSGSASSTGQVTLALSSGASVQWGDNEEQALKAQVLSVLLSQPASVYDVSSPHSPTTK